MILTTEQIDLLHKCIGGGRIDTASIIIFGNELGTAEGGTTERTIEKFQKDWKSGPILPINLGFSTLNISTPPVNSTFLQFISRLVLAIKYKEERFFNKLEGQAKAFVNNFITHELYRTDTAIINLRPLPQSTERHWDYENINEKEYYKQYNFTLRRPLHDSWKDFRVCILKDAFYLNPNALILGSGDKYNKKGFLKLIYPEIEFTEIKLQEGSTIFVSQKPKVILSNYYDYRNGLGLSGLREIYQYIINNEIL